MKYFSPGVIDAKSLSITEWIKQFSKPESIYPNSCFPTDEMLTEYISIIDSRSSQEVKSIIRNLLVHNGGFGSDDSVRIGIKNLGSKEVANMINSQEFIRRIVSSKLPWEGITWKV